MPKNTEIKKVLVIGSGPIVIGQAAEFDYAGTQACRALKEEGLEVVLVNSNPATIMTDNAMADRDLHRAADLPNASSSIIEKEQPDSLLSTLGGQTGLNLAMELAEERLPGRAWRADCIGTQAPTPSTRRRTVRRSRIPWSRSASPCIASKVVDDRGGRAGLCRKRSVTRSSCARAYTLGGTGGGIAIRPEELHEIAAQRPRAFAASARCWWKSASPAGRRSSLRSCATARATSSPSATWKTSTRSACTPATPSSWRPAQTLADKEYQMLRTAALNIITALEIEGGCNVPVRAEARQL